MPLPPFSQKSFYIDVLFPDTQQESPLPPKTVSIRKRIPIARQINPPPTKPTAVTGAENTQPNPLPISATATISRINDARPNPKIKANTVAKTLTTTPSAAPPTPRITGEQIIHPSMISTIAHTGNSSFSFFVPAPCVSPPVPDGPEPIPVLLVYP